MEKARERAPEGWDVSGGRGDFGRQDVEGNPPDRECAAIVFGFLGEANAW